MLKSNLFCIKNPEKIVLNGEISQPAWRTLNIKVNKCNKDILPEGQICKTDDEIEAYMSQMQFVTYVKTNYIQNSDIDDPIKSHFLIAESYVLDTKKHLAKRLKLTRNTFNNMDKMF